MIIKDKSKLETPCEVVSIKEGEEIAVRILDELRKSKTPGVGLAANQIGINKRVCVVNVKEPLVLINPKIVEKSEDKFIFPEGCLSFPKKYVRTERHVSVTVKADNHDSKLSFSADSEDNDKGLLLTGKYGLRPDEPKFGNDGQIKLTTDSNVSSYLLITEFRRNN